MSVDMVNEPPHYKSHPSGVECIEIVKHMNFCLGNAIKYIWRAGEKGNLLEDLRKARKYLDFEIERLEAIESNAKPISQVNAFHKYAEGGGPDGLRCVHEFETGRCGRFPQDITHTP